MKRLIVVLSILLFASTSFAQGPGYEAKIINPIEKVDDGGKCPITKVVGKVNDCITCHVLTTKDGKAEWKIKESEPFSEFNTPYATKFKVIDGEVVGWYDFQSIEAGRVRKAIEYYKRHGIKKLIFNISSWGGSAFDGYAIVNLFDAERTDPNGIEIITQVQSYAMSAGFLAWVAGHKRYASPMAVLMWHQVSYTTFLAKVTPAGSEETAKMMRGWQLTADSYISSRSGVDLKRIQQETAHKDWYMSGAEAVEMGFGDELIK